MPDLAARVCPLLHQAGEHAAHAHAGAAARRRCALPCAAERRRHGPSAARISPSAPACRAPHTSAGCPSAGAKIVFLKSGYELRRGFADKDESGGKGAERAAEGAAKPPAGGAQADSGAQEALRAAAMRGKPDGALRLIFEQNPAQLGGGARVRVVRCDMEEGGVVKEMSESAILRRLAKELPNRA